MINNTYIAGKLEELLMDYTVVRTDYRFYSSKLFFPEALTRKSKTIAYIGHVKRTCFN